MKLDTPEKRQKRNTWLRAYRINRNLNPLSKISFIVSSAKTRSKSKNLPFDIDVKYVEQLLIDQDYRCAVSNREFEFTPSEFRVNPHALSIDRIIPELGYTKDNIRLVTWQVNCAISEFGLDYFLELCQDVVEFSR